jgi:hypothetical protein
MKHAVDTGSETSESEAGEITGDDTSSEWDSFDSESDGGSTKLSFKRVNTKPVPLEVFLTRMIHRLHNDRQRPA